MSSKYWTPSTVLSETSSGGLFQEHSETHLVPWSLNPTQDPGEAGRTYIYGTANSFGQELSFRFEGTGGLALRRLVGCVILSALPDEDVDEALRSLKDIVEFRLVDSAPSIRRLAPVTSLTRDAVVRRVSRPNMVISEP